MTTWCDTATASMAVASGNRVFVQGACSTPTPLLEALVARGEMLSNVEIVHLHTYGPTPYTEERWRGHFTLRALFVGENIRQAANSGRASYTPVFLADVPALFAPGGELPLDVAFVQVSPPDAHGYQRAIHEIIHGRPNAERFHVRGFREQGTTTTPFDMVVLNGMSRYHLCIEALRYVPRLHEQAQGLIAECTNLIARATAYPHEHLEDQPEIANWVWSA